MFRLERESSRAPVVSRTISNSAALLLLLPLIAGVAPRLAAQGGEWTWMGGTSHVSENGVYGILEKPATTNVPGGRYEAASWTDLDGNLWLLGGDGRDCCGGSSDLNDLWKYTPATGGLGEWTWMGGSDSVATETAVYGKVRVAAAANQPGGRRFVATWTDLSGNLWLFGGRGFDSTGTVGSLNDLWRYTPSTGEWTWMGGSDSAATETVDYGKVGVAAAANQPGGRYGATSLRDASGDFWLFGGAGFDANGEDGDLSDIWKYSPVSEEWTWMGGNKLRDRVGVYGGPGTPAPGGRLNAAGWIDLSGNVWIFGGDGDGSINNSGNLNDLWQFAPSTGEWTWMGGTSLATAPSVYGTRGMPAAGNTPGARSAGVSWTDADGGFWLFGGNGNDALGAAGAYNDLWEYNPLTREWAWIGGSDVPDQNGIYGPVGMATTFNVPGGRYWAVGWNDLKDNFWLFSGFGFDAEGDDAALNDVWTYTVPTAATPVLKPAGGKYDAPQKVRISDTTTGAAIHYTLDGSPPTASSPVYGGTLTVAETETVSAIALAAGYLNSGVESAAYQITGAGAPTFSLPDGTYNSVQFVSLTSVTPNASIYYTTNGLTPTKSSSLFSTSIPITTSTTLKAIAIAPGLTNSPVATAIYALQAPVPVISPPGGSFTTPPQITMTDALNGATIYYTLNGAIPVPGTSPAYTASFQPSQSASVRAIATFAGFKNSGVASAAISLDVSAPTFSTPSGTYAIGQKVALATSTPGAAIHYTVNGTRPTAASLLYKGPIALFASAPIRAIAVLSGWVNSNVAIAAYKVVGPPQAKTGAAAKVTASTAALTGTANDLGAAAQAWFVWGTSSTSLTSTSGSINLAASNSSQAVNITIQGLAANTKYYFQEVVTTVGGTSKGAIVSFTTP